MREIADVVYGELPVSAFSVESLMTKNNVYFYWIGLFLYWNIFQEFIYIITNHIGYNLNAIKKRDIILVLLTQRWKEMAPSNQIS
jgi:hypothetical protein